MRISPTTHIIRNSCDISFCSRKTLPREDKTVKPINNSGFHYSHQEIPAYKFIWDNILLTWANSFLIKHYTYQDSLQNPHVAKSTNPKLVCHKYCPISIILLSWNIHLKLLVPRAENPTDILPNCPLWCHYTAVSMWCSPYCWEL